MRAREFVSEKWTAKYKRSIDCSHPKGFSQRAHCDGRKKNEDLNEFADNELDESVNEALSRRDLLKGAGASALAGAIGYNTGKVSVYEEKTAFELGYCDQFLSMINPESVRNNPYFKTQFENYRWWSKRVDAKLKSTDAYKQGRASAKHEISQYTAEYKNTKESIEKLISNFTHHVTNLGNNAGYISRSDEQLDELTFKGSPCTKDCSGHRAGYDWSQRKGGQYAASWSPSFNNGAALFKNGY